MNDISVFFNTEVKNTGWLSAIGNFFLAPTRFLFSGKSIIIKHDDTSDAKTENVEFAKVTSFFPLQLAEWEPVYKKVSKQNPELESTPWGISFDVFLLPIIMLALFIPFAIIGSIFKAFSYLDKKAQETHNIVKDKLTPQNKHITAESEEDLNRQLSTLLMSGQKTNALIISAEITQIPTSSLKLMKKLNPSKLVLDGAWNSENCNIRPHIQNASKSEYYKTRDWDISALEANSQRNIVSSISDGLNLRLSFFSPRHTVIVVNPQSVASNTP